MSVAEAVDSLGSIPFVGTVFRHVSVRWPCVSGAGAQRSGGRWNPPESFPTLYCALSFETAIAELNHFASSHSLPAAVLLPRKVCELEVTLRHVLDLRPLANQRSLEITRKDLTSRDWSACQEVGRAAYSLELEGLLAPSGTGVGDVLALFEMHLRQGSQMVEARSYLLEELPSRRPA